MNQSDAINELAKALSAAQGEMEGAAKSSENPFFKSKYADLASVWDAIRKPFSKHGLSVVQATDFDESQSLIVVTRLLHSSGQWIEGRLKMPIVKPDPQSIGSLVSYSRRYSLAAIAGVCPVDDDAEGAMERPAIPEVKRTVNGGLISEPQQKRLWALAKQYNRPEEWIKALLGREGFESSAQITKARYDVICELVQTGA